MTSDRGKGVGGGSNGIIHVVARMPVNILQCTRTHNKNYLAQNVNRAKVEKPDIMVYSS